MSRGRGGAMAVAAFALLLASCGSGEAEADPQAVDAHLNRIVERDEAERRRLVEEARTREDVREREMEQRSGNDGEAAD